MKINREKLHFYCKRKGTNPTRLARTLGYDSSHIYDWYHTSISFLRVMQISSYLGCLPNDIIEFRPIDDVNKKLTQEDMEKLFGSKADDEILELAENSDIDWETVDDYPDLPDVSDIELDVASGEIQYDDEGNVKQRPQTKQLQRLYDFKVHRTTDTKHS